MKQKVVIKVCLDEKSRKKVLKTVADHSGVESLALKGKDMNELEVVGDGIDSVKIVNLLRKNLGYAVLLSVGPAGDKKDPDKEKGAKKDGKEKKEPKPATGSSGSSCVFKGAPYVTYEFIDSGCEPNCTIM